MANVNNLEQECKVYLNYCLTKSGCWGGSETIKAVSRLYKVHVIIFNEYGPCYLVDGFNSDYERSIILWYRLAHAETESQRNHYDSVINIKQTDTFNCMKSMMKAINENFFNDEKETIIVED